MCAPDICSAVSARTSARGSRTLQTRCPKPMMRLRAAREAYRVEHAVLRLDPEARNLRHTYVQPSDDGTAWRVQQILVDPEGLNDWVMELAVDLAASREVGEPVLQLLRLGSLV